jgi:hypothetical protein
MLCAAAGLESEAAVRHATRADPDGPGAELVGLLSKDRPGEWPVSVRESQVGRYARALDRWLEDGTAADEALVLASAHLYLGQGWLWDRSGRPFVVLAVPALACIVPAALLLAMV